MKNWYSSIYKGCIIASIIAFIIGFFTQSVLSLGAYIAGYSVLTLGIMVILIILFNNVLRVTQNGSTLQILNSIFMTSGPFILIFIVISFVLYLLITYQEQITRGHVSPSYNSFSNIIIMLLLVQIYLIYININTDNFESTGKIPKVISSIIYLLGVLTSICAIILNTILKYFSTDGFTNIN